MQRCKYRRHALQAIAVTLLMKVPPVLGSLTARRHLLYSERPSSKAEDTCARIVSFNWVKSFDVMCLYISNAFTCVFLLGSYLLIQVLCSCGHSSGLLQSFLPLLFSALFISLLVAAGAVRPLPHCWCIVLFSVCRLALP